MNTQADLTAKKPIEWWNKRLSFSFSESFFAIGKAAAFGAACNWSGTASNLIDALNNVSDQDKASAAAWLLIYRALEKTLLGLVNDYKDFFNDNCSEDELKRLAKYLEEELNVIEIELDFTFFNHPQKLPLFEQLKAPLYFWLCELGLKEHEANAFNERLRIHFILALHKCWLEKPSDYACIEEKLNSPFVKATQVEREWMQYHAWLQEQVNQRMFSEAFSLQQVYVRLRAFYLRKIDESYSNEDIEPKNADVLENTPGLEHSRDKYEKVVVDLHQELIDWTKNFDPDDSIRVISGGPGSGKSSFAKMFAAQVVTEAVNVAVLFVPLHHFAIDDDLSDAIERFVKYDLYLNHSPFDTKTGKDRLLLIFDGLDELSIHGKASIEAAEQFVGEVIAKLDRFNAQGLKRQALITGRDLSIQTNAHRLRGKKQIFHTLPYFMEEGDRTNYIDEKGLLAEDQRNLWWKNYGIAKNKPVHSMPDILSSVQLTPITREPLLNYLVALSYERERINFDEETTLNEIYSDLLRSVYERQWEGVRGRQHTSIETLEYEKFERVLEEIALTVWHGNGRTASEKDIFDKLESSNLKKYLKVFQESAMKGVSRLLTAFYFRQSDNNLSENKTFEFTHKSFGEYLIAKRLFRSIKHLHYNLTENEQDPDNGFNEIEALKRWAKITGPTAIDFHILNFLCIEVHNETPEALTELQKTFGKLLGLAVRKGMPMHELGNLDFRLMQTWSRNAEEMLLVVHSACALKTKKILKIDWQGMFSEWLLRIIGNESVFLPATKRYLQYLNLEYENFAFYNFTDANLTGSNLRNTNLYRANLHSANLDSVDFTDTNLKGAVLTRSKLRKAKIINADLKGAQFGIDFQDCGASLYRRTRIQRRGLRDILEDAILDGSDLEGAFLRGVRFAGTSLNGTNLKHTRLISDSVATDKFNEHTVFPEGIDRDECLEAHRAYILRSHERELYPEINTDHEDD